MSNRITLQQAMETLSNMFPDIDPSICKDTLYKTNGHMERTIEILLQMQERMIPPRRVSNNVPSQQKLYHGVPLPNHTLPDDFLCYRNESLPSPPPMNQVG